MTGEVKTLGNAFSHEYPIVEDPEAYMQFMLEDVSEGRIDGVLLRGALKKLDFCISDPRHKLFMFVRRWEQTPETEATYEPPFTRVYDPASKMVSEQAVDADKIPRDTSFLFDRLYTLTGASVVRDDLSDGSEHGAVIRRGEYKGTPIYFRETYEKLDEDSIYFNPDIDGQRSFVIEVMGEQRGEIALTELSTHQKATLALVIGGKLAWSLSDPHHPGEGWDQIPTINRENFHNIKELVEAVGSSAVKRAKERLLKQNLGVRVLHHLGLLKTGADPRFPE